jgi:hypothetical protein
MKGQWVGDYAGTNRGSLVLDLDEVADHYEGSALALESNPSVPPTLAVLLNVPKGQKSFQLRIPLIPIDRVSGRAVSWDELKKNYPSDVTPANYADTKWVVGTDTIEISWVTDIGTNGKGVIRKSRSTEPSVLIPLPQVTTWEEYRRFARTLEPYQHIFRGQRSNQWRLRTSFHRTGRSSLVRYELNDIPALHRHLSGMMAQSLDLRDPLHNAAFYNLIQHHGYPTPLLDWTYSPFIAAYFAYNRVPRLGVAADDRVRIFIFDKVWIKDFESVFVVSPPKLHFTLLEPLALNNPRVVPQQSVSSVTNVDDIEEYLTYKESRSKKQYLRAIDLPASERKLVMEELSLMGITAGSLFPGIDGACEQLRDRFFGM